MEERERGKERRREREKESGREEREGEREVLISSRTTLIVVGREPSKD